VKILVIQGVNLNRLGHRERGVYGSRTLEEFNLEIELFAAYKGVRMEFFQSNSERAIVERIHAAAADFDGFDGIVINPAAHTHYSVAIRDALAAVNIPAVEVHISNIHAREDFREHSVTAGACIGQISGFGALSYCLAIDAIVERAAGALVLPQNLRKTPYEIENMRTAASIANDAFTYIKEYVSPGKTERDIALELEFFMRKNGAEGLAFDTIVASGERSANPHAVPSDEKIPTNGYVMLDFGCKVNGCCSDMTRMIACGEISPQMRKIHDIVQEAQTAALSVIREGARASDVDKAARDIINAAGFAENFMHSTGHGVGTVVHEEPRISPKSTAILEEGMVITVEPGIYLEGVGGVRLEDMVVVTKDGCRNLSYGKTN
jgi:3-dehydroquinate dehydratase type II